VEKQPDFSTRNVYVLAMGQKPSAGYSLTVVPSRSEIRDQVFHIAVEAVEPAQDAVTASVITTPCVVFALPKGSYSGVEAEGYRLEP
jgi:hypothetical protein